jgi:hypothetical protein
VKVSPWWLVLGVFICLGLGWRARELFGPAVVRHEHTLADMPMVSSAESLIIRYQFDSTTCTVRRVRP